VFQLSSIFVPLTEVNTKKKLSTKLLYPLSSVLADRVRDSVGKGSKGEMGGDGRRL